MIVCLQTDELLSSDSCRREGVRNDCSFSIGGTTPTGDLSRTACIVSYRYGATYATSLVQYLLSHAVRRQDNRAVFYMPRERPAAEAEAASTDEEHFRAGVVHHLAERLSEALAEYKLALVLQPRHPAVLLNQGGALLKLAEYARADAKKCSGYWRAAEKSMKRSVQYAPESTDAYLNLGVLYKTICGDELPTKRLPQAIAAYTAAAKISPGKSELHEKLGAILLTASDAAPGGSEQKLNSASDAAAAFGAAVKLSPEDGVLWERRGDAFLAVAAHEQSRPGGHDVARALEQLHGQQPAAAAAASVTATSSTALDESGLASPSALAKSAYAEAVACFASAVRLNPDGAGAYTKLAIAAHGVGLRNDPAMAKALLVAMRQLQLAASTAANYVVQLPSYGETESTCVVSTDEASSEGTTSMADSRPTLCNGRPTLHEASATSSSDSLSAETCEVEYDGSELPGQSKAAAGCAGVRAFSIRAASVDGDVDVGRSRLVAAFATPLFLHRLPRRVVDPLHAALVPELQLRSRQQTSVRHSNRGGWQSASNLLSADDPDLAPPLRKLRALALDAAASYVRALHAAAAPRRSPKLTREGGRPAGPPDNADDRVPRVRMTILNAWANINRFGDLNLFHDHPQAVISGVYFVDDGVVSSAAGAGDASLGGTRTSGSVDRTGLGPSSKGQQGNRTQLRERTNLAATSRCGDMGGNGSIELIDPRLSLRTHRPPEQFEPSCAELGGSTRSLRNGYMYEYAAPLQIEPTPGTFLLFPAWLMHRVRPHSRKRAARVSISFNIWLADDEEPSSRPGSGLSATERLFGPSALFHTAANFV